jgi:hypothetical protein
VLGQSRRDRQIQHPLRCFPGGQEVGAALQKLDVDLTALKLRIGEQTAMKCLIGRDTGDDELIESLPHPAYSLSPVRGPNDQLGEH